MFNALSPTDFVVASEFRWRGLVYKKGSGLPPGMPQGAIHQFLHKDPPLIKIRPKRRKASNGNGAIKASRKKSSKKTSKRG